MGAIAGYDIPRDDYWMTEEERKRLEDEAEAYEELREQEMKDRSRT